MIALKLTEHQGEQVQGSSHQYQDNQYKLFKLVLIFVFVCYFPSFLRANYLLVEPQELLYEFEDSYNVTPNKPRLQAKLPKFSMSFAWKAAGEEFSVYLPSADPDITRLFNLYRSLKKVSGDSRASQVGGALEVRVLDENSKEIDSAIIANAAMKSAMGFSLINILEAKANKSEKEVRSTRQ